MLVHNRPPSFNLIRSLWKHNDGRVGKSNKPSDDRCDCMVQSIICQVDRLNSEIERWQRRADPMVLPEDVLKHVFDMLDHRDLVQAMCVSHLWRDRVIERLTSPQFDVQITPVRFNSYLDCCTRTLGSCDRVKRLTLGSRLDLVSQIRPSLAIDDLCVTVQNEYELANLYDTNRVSNLKVRLRNLIDPAFLRSFLVNLTASSLSLYIDKFYLSKYPEKLDRGVCSLTKLELGDCSDKIDRVAAERFRNWLFESTSFPQLREMILLHLSISRTDLQACPNLQSITFNDVPMRLGRVIQILAKSHVSVQVLEYSSDSPDTQSFLPNTDLSILTTLQSLVLPNCKLSVNDLMHLLQASPNLLELVLKNSDIRFDVAFPFKMFLDVCPQLEVLSLSGCKHFDNNSCRRLAELLVVRGRCNIQELYLCRSSVTMAGIHYLFSSVSPLRLSVLGAEGCQLDDDYVEYLTEAGYISEVSYEHYQMCPRQMCD